MTAQYIHEDFLLETPAARRLFHEFAEGLPIIDYHCHLPPAEIALDRRWDNLTQIWLHGDHYKWRAMRSNGVAERACTGDASDREKFDAWAATVPYLVRNQLYPWTHLELARYFGIDDLLLGPETADQVWRKAEAVLAEPWFSARGIMKRFKVVVVCTTDDPTDSLEHHEAMAAAPALAGELRRLPAVAGTQDGGPELVEGAADAAFDVKILPAWRPDRGMKPEDPAAFNAWVDKLAAAADVDVTDFGSYMEALRKRHAFFHEAGCRLSDHGVEVIYSEECTASEAAAIFAKARAGRELDEAEIVRFRSAMLHEFAVMDAEKDWTQQYHYGVLRNNNTRLFRELGPDVGCDSIGDFEVGRAMSRFFDRLDLAGKLARTIVYSLNPCDNMLLATMIGNFQDGSCPGKMQFGSAWWCLDQKEGMEQQMRDLSQTGLLSRFVGMLTDSRSFLSYPRHEYFRRILCNLLGADMTTGYIPEDFDLVGRMVRDISYNNAARYFKFGVPEVEG